MANNDFSEQLLQTIDMLVEQRVGTIHFDETIPCKIVSIVDKNTRLYEVQYNSTIYKAYAKTDETYRVNDQVYVNIPGGDYSNQVKLILGKYTSEKDNALEYIDPFAHIAFNKTINLWEKTTGLFPMNKQEYTFTRGTEEFNSIFNQLQNTTLSGYDTMGLELGLSNQAAEKWGIQIDFCTEDNTIIHSVENTSPYVFSSDEVMGDPAYLLPTIRQKKVFSFPSSLYLSNIHKIIIKRVGPVQLYFCNLTFGYDAKRFIGKPIHLYIEGDQDSIAYSPSGKIYGGYESKTEEDGTIVVNKKELENIALKALLVDQSNGIVLTTVPDNQVVRWYRYEIGAVGDKMGGGYWQFLSSSMPGDIPQLIINKDNINTTTFSTSFKAVLCENIAATAIGKLIIDYYDSDSSFNTAKDNSNNHQQILAKKSNNSTVFYEYKDNTWLELNGVNTAEDIVISKINNSQYPNNATIALIEIYNNVELEQIRYYPNTAINNIGSSNISGLNKLATSDTFILYSVEHDIIANGVLRAEPDQTGIIVAYDINGTLIPEKKYIDIEVKYDNLVYDTTIVCQLSTRDDPNDTLIQDFYLVAQDKDDEEADQEIITTEDQPGVEPPTGDQPEVKPKELHISVGPETTFPITIRCELKNTYQESSRDGVDNFIIFYDENKPQVQDNVSFTFARQEAQMGVFTIEPIENQTFDLYGVDNTTLRTDIETKIEFQVVLKQTVNINATDYQWSFEDPNDTGPFQECRGIGNTCTLITKKNEDITGNETRTISIKCEANNGLYSATYTFTVGSLPPEGLPNGEQLYQITPSNQHFSYYDETTRQLHAAAPKEVKLMLVKTTENDNTQNPNSYVWKYTKPYIGGNESVGQISGITPKVGDNSQATMTLCKEFLMDNQERIHTVTCVVDNAYLIQTNFTFGCSVTDGTILLGANYDQSVEAYSALNGQRKINSITVTVQPASGQWPGWSNSVLNDTDDMEIIWRIPENNTLLSHFINGKNEQVQEVILTDTPSKLSFSAECYLKGNWNSAYKDAPCNPITCIVNGHVASINFAFEQIEPSGVIEIVHGDNNNHFPIYSEEINQDQSKQGKLLSWASNPIQLTARSLVSTIIPASYEWKIDSSNPFIAGFATTANSTKWTKSISGGSSNTIWCKFNETVQNPNWDADTTITCVADGCYSTFSSFSFGSIESDGVISLDAIDQTLSVYDWNGKLVSWKDSYISIELELIKSTGGLLQKDIRTIEWKIENSNGFFSSLAWSKSPTVTLEPWKRSNSDEIPPMTIYAYLNSTWVNTTLPQKISCIVNGTYRASISFTFSKLVEEEIVILEPAVDQISAYNTNGKRLSAFESGFQLVLKKLPEKAFPSKKTEHELQWVVSNNVIATTANNLPTKWDETTNNVPLTQNFAIKDTIANNTNFTDTIHVVVDDLYHAQAEIIFNKIDINNNKISLDAEGDTVEYGQFSKKPTTNSPKYIPIYLTDLAGNRLTKGDTIDGTTISTITWRLITQGASVTTLSASKESNTNTYNAAVVYAKINQNKLDTLAPCQIKCTVNGIYSATISLNFNYADSDNVIMIDPPKIDIPAYNRDSGNILSWWAGKLIQLEAKSIDPTITLKGVTADWSIVTPESKYQQIGLDETNQTGSLTSIWDLEETYLQSSTGRQEHVVQCIVDGAYRATAELDFSLAAGSKVFELQATEYDWEFSNQTNKPMPYNSPNVALTVHVLNQDEYNSAVGEGNTPSFIWKVNGNTVAGTTGTTYTYTLPTAKPSQETVIRCEVNNKSDCYAEIVISPTTVDTQNMIHIASNQTSHIVCYTAHEALDTDHPVATNGLILSATLPSGLQSPKKITWAIPESNSLLDTLELSTQNDNNQWTISYDNNTSKKKITITPTGNASLPLDIKCTLTQRYVAANAGENSNKITCIVDGVYEAQYFVSFGQGETDGNIYITAADTTKVVAYNAASKRLTDYNNGIQITVKPTARAKSSGLWAVGKTIKLDWSNPSPSNSNQQNGLFSARVETDENGQNPTLHYDKSEGISKKSETDTDPKDSITFTVPLKETFNLTQAAENQNIVWASLINSSGKVEAEAQTQFSFAQEGSDDEVPFSLTCQYGSYVIAYDNSGKPIRLELPFIVTPKDNNITAKSIKWTILNHSGLLYFGESSKMEYTHTDTAPSPDSETNTIKQPIKLKNTFSYSQSSDSQNIIQCEITASNNKSYKLQIAITLARLSSGTQYSFSLDGGASKYLKNTTNSTITLTPTLYYYYPEMSTSVFQQITTQHNLSYEWYSSTTQYQKEDKTEEDMIGIEGSTDGSGNPQIKLTLNHPFTNIGNPQYNNYILKVTCQVQALYDNGEDPSKSLITLEAFYPVKLYTGSSNNITLPTGIFELAWDSNGNLLTSMSNNIYKDSETNGGTWYISYFDKYEDTKAQPYTVTFNQLGFSGSTRFENRITPCIYNSNWQVPLFVHISKHDVDLSNRWSGSSIWVDRQQYTVMATAIGAGTKNPSSNTFTGVLMGSFAKGGSGQKVNGLYGFSDGESTFRIDATSGDAYFAGSGIFKGHIEASSGKIGGWIISETDLSYNRKRESGKAQMFICPNGTQLDNPYTVGSKTGREWFMYLSTSNENNAKGQFGILQDGTLYAESAYLNGDNGYQYDWHPEKYGSYDRIPAETIEWSPGQFRHPSEHLVGLYLNTKFNAIQEPTIGKRMGMLGLILTARAEGAQRYYERIGGTAQAQTNLEEQTLGELVLGQVIPARANPTYPGVNSSMGVHDLTAHPGMAIQLYGNSSLLVGIEPTDGRKSTYIEFYPDLINVIVQGDIVHTFYPKSN